MNKAYLAKWLRYNAVFKPLASLPMSLAYRGASLVGRYDSQYQRAARALIAANMQKALPQQMYAKRSYNTG